MKKYIVYGGYVKSKNDGQIHYIDSLTVCRLYKVSPAECIFPDREIEASREHGKYKELYPRSDGEYNLD